MQLELADLLARCHAGDQLAWEAFVRRFQGRIYSIAYSYAGNPDDARDLAQDIFVRLYSSRRQWAAADRFLPWLIAIARNLSVDYLRRRRARTSATEVGLDAAAELTGGSLDPEAQLTANRRRSLVWQALRRLTQISRETIVLRDIHGLSLEEVATTLHIPVGTAKSRTSRARIELAQQVLAISRPVELPGTGSREG
jgi:RNA polymerase sigma-70 factor (ECF subfamily)